MSNRKRKRREPIIIEVTAEKLVFGGQAIAHYTHETKGPKTVFLWNALPGEHVRALITKRRKGVWEGVATEILTPSPDRIEPREPDSFLSTSPWQMLPIEKELEFKHAIALETYEHIGKFDVPDEIASVHLEDSEFGYRNKMEFSFYEVDPAYAEASADEPDKPDFPDFVHDSSVHLAFFHRGKKYKMPVQGSDLAEPVINSVAKRILAWVNEAKLTRRDLKSLIVRSNGNGQAVAALFLKEELTFDPYPALDDELVGLKVYYSTHKSPASVPTKLMYAAGLDTLQAELAASGPAVKLQFGLLSFFQINIPLFQRVLEDIAEYIPQDKPLLDFYSGVGAIGLPLASHVPQVTLVEVNKEAVQFANVNIQMNGIENAQAHCVPAEGITELITGNETVIVDPPRAGLHADVTKRLLETEPEVIVYMSCNISTQARDLGLLAEKYDISGITLYNFFPRTPHIEALAILNKK